ncbi:hypothetical protein L484_021792 [Morus notabilis]|uniref:Uncharacterized protein n=1 Tax=Morus notabilis TaxID=981085 RepID=W9R3S4_9ROSA|nr:hypothetical protein L484_021792 [Morus notabilis]
MEALIFPEELRTVYRSPLPTLKHLKVKTRSRMPRVADLREALCWASPSLESLSMKLD